MMGEGTHFFGSDRLWSSVLTEAAGVSALAVFTAVLPIDAGGPQDGRSIERCFTWKSAGLTSLSLMSDVLPFLGCFFLFRVCCPQDHGRAPASSCASESRPIRRRPGGVIPRETCFVMNSMAHGAAPAPQKQTDIDPRAAVSCNVQTSRPVPVFPPLPPAPEAWCCVRPIPGGAAISSSAPRCSRLARPSPAPHA